MHVPLPPLRRRSPLRVAAALTAAAPMAAPASSQVLAVESVQPAQNALHVRTATSLVIDFDDAVDAASVASNCCNPIRASATCRSAIARRSAIRPPNSIGWTTDTA